MFKCLKNLGPLHLSNDITLVSETHNVHIRSSQQNNVHVPKPNTEIFKKSFKYHEAILWNTLPVELKHAQCIDEFKHLYKQRFF